MKKTLTVLCLIAMASALPASAQVDFSRYCALGDSLTAGFVSGGLSQEYQRHSYPAVLAGLAGASTFEQPLISEPGIPPLMELQALIGPNGSPVIEAPAVQPGMPINAEYPGIYNNLGVPGSNLYDLMFTTGDIMNLLAGNQDNVMHDIVLRNGVNTALEQCIGLDPTFVTMWIGNNDILSAVLAATPIDGVTLTPVETFEQLYPQALGALATNTSADIVVMTLPYPTTIPFVTTVSPFLDIPGVGTIPITGTNGPLEAGDYVTLAGASMLGQGYGVPGGPPLPEDLDLATGAPGYVLRAAEAELINARVDAFNAIIRATASNFGATVLDANAIFNDIVNGQGRRFGSWEPTADFLLGGIFSYDGVHPQDLGYAIFAVELIEHINTYYDAAIPQVNMYEAMGSSSYNIPDISNAKDAVFSQSSFEQLWKLFGPDLPENPGPVTQEFTN